ncbi:MAG: LEA type 2 family protein [Burkholderiaceae bacterium]|nr:LEA type 2 family protein [Burkholderiaceae bacterium]MEB2350310.1 LEA type 2 family protein [Burkholderiaceae bacterium]
MRDRPVARYAARTLALAALLLALSGCAGFGLGEPPRVDVVGVEPIPGEGMETRFALKLRVLNPNETPIEFDGAFVELDVRGARFASGVSDQRGVAPRFGETVITVPMSVPVGAMIRQMIDLASSERVRTDYRMRGKLSGPGFGAYRFESSGELQLPAGLVGPAR